MGETYIVHQRKGRGIMALVYTLVASDQTKVDIHSCAEKCECCEGVKRTVVLRTKFGPNHMGLDYGSFLQLTPDQADEYASALICAANRARLADVEE